MCIVLQSEIDKMLLLINDYVRINGTSDLKDYLADSKENGLISHCGCEGLFEIKPDAIYIEISSGIYKFVLGEKPMVIQSCHSEAIDNY